jgi:hypothetical protein
MGDMMGSGMALAKAWHFKVWTCEFDSNKYAGAGFTGSNHVETTWICESPFHKKNSNQKQNHPQEWFVDVWKCLSEGNVIKRFPLIFECSVILCHTLSYYDILHAMRGWYWFIHRSIHWVLFSHDFTCICISDINVCREAGKWSRPSAEPVGFFYTHQITVNKIKSVQNHWRNIRNRINKS